MSEQETIRLCHDTLDAVREFMAVEYGCPEASALDGHPIAKGNARQIWNRVCEALTRAEMAL